MRSTLVTVLEMKRAQLGISKVEFVPKIASPGNRSYYTHIVAGRYKVPDLWYPQIATLLGISIPEVGFLAMDVFEVIDPWLYLSDRRFSPEELRDLAKVAELIGEPASLKNLIRISAEIKTAASK